MVRLLSGMGKKRFGDRRAIHTTRNTMCRHSAALALMKLHSMSGHNSSPVSRKVTPSSSRGRRRRQGRNTVHKLQVTATLRLTHRNHDAYTVSVVSTYVSACKSTSCRSTLDSTSDRLSTTASILSYQSSYISSYRIPGVPSLGREHASNADFGG
jgi:hypothetical protein